MKRVFASLDRHTICECEYDEPDRYRELFALDRNPLIARGAGISYVAASFGTGVTSIGMRRFNRILAFDKDKRTIEVEAGITLAQLFEFLTPRGLTLPVQPGHPHITVGGCIAGNVHGKNQYRDGLFGDHVRAMKLFHPAHGLLDLSPTHNAGLFDLTLGGFGLTGIIVSAQLALSPLPSITMLVEHIPIGDLGEAFARLGELKASRDMLYAWLDLTDDKHLGRGYIVAANSEPSARVEPRPIKARKIMPAARRPFRVFSNATIPLINRLYRAQALRRRRTPHLVPLNELLYPAVGKEYYFDAFGKAGFIELQTLLPEGAAGEFVARMPALIRKHGQAIALTTLKVFGGKRHLLNYGGDGFSFTIDVGNDPGVLQLLSDLDDLNSDLGAITAIMKDSRLSAAVTRRQYSGYDTFKQRLHAQDPQRRFVSALSRRLEL